MRIEAFGFPNQVRLSAFAGKSSAFLARLDADTWTRTAGTVREAGGRLISLWGSEEPAGTFAMSVAYALEDGILWLQLPVDDGHGDGGRYPDLSTVFPCATRMQRAVYDLLGLSAMDARDTRPWLNHGNWPVDYHPLQKLSSGTERFQSAEADYPFVHVAGDGVHEIAVGPIHAG
ncbi:NADH-quinone oxidoreductase subunit C, partial [Caballeronia terrestris]